MATEVLIMAERGREGKTDIDRFLAEIERLRKKAQGGTSPPPIPVAKAKPVEAKPKAKPRLDMPPPATIPTVGSARPAPVLDVPVVARPVAVAVPVAPPVIIAASPPGSVRTEVPSATNVKAVRTVAAAGQGSQRAMTPFARQLSAILASGSQSVPMAIVLGEILGPPKSQRG
ncbi:MAG: hypothetical protein U0798_11375 [Gemmataceae bacterium]